MAIDTEEKRRSALLSRVVLPVGDGSIAEGDRIHVGALYAGLDLGAGAPPASGVYRLAGSGGLVGGPSLLVGPGGGLSG